MRISLLATLALAAFATSSMAADLQPRSIAPVAVTPLAPAFAAPAPAFSWDGLYVGATAGYAWNDNSSKYLRDSGSLGPLADKIGGATRDVFNGGIVAGYNWQFGNVVLGAEADVSSLGRESAGGRYSNGAYEVSRNGVEWLALARTRLGYAFDRTLVYAAGGIAYGDVKDTSYVYDGREWSGSRSKDQWGWTLGGGIEHALTNNFSVKAEYLHYDLGRVNYALVGDAEAVASGDTLRVKSKAAGDLVRLGVNYRF